MKYVVKFSEMKDEDFILAGGKGSSLGKMTRNKINVPKGIVILANAFENNVINEKAIMEISEFISEHNEEVTYAVRSSAIEEDGLQASFAGAYETILDVKKKDVLKAVRKVIRSGQSERVDAYIENKKLDCKKNNIAVVIQQFIKPEFAGVLFTANPVTGSSAEMVGNYVNGVGEQLVSGEGTGKEFTINALKYQFSGENEIKKYGKKFYKTAKKILEIYSCPQDIEWAVKDNKIYILQARPITTLQRFNRETYEINGTLSGDYLLSATNIGEIFLNVVSPVTYSILDSICDAMGVPNFIDNVCGHAYANLSALCSLIVSFGVSQKKAYAIIKDLAGEIPEGTEIPIFPVNKKAFLKKLLKMVTTKKSKDVYSNIKNKDFVNNMEKYAKEIIYLIKNSQTPEELLDIWINYGEPYTMRSLISIMGGLSIKPLLKTRVEIINVAGEELGNTLCSNCSLLGELESMKPLLGLEKVISGEITREEYAEKYGHRSPNEMELSMAYPYEDGKYIDKLIEEYKKSDMSAKALKEKQIIEFERAKKQFIIEHKNKEKWLNKKLYLFAKAMNNREELRSKGVRIFTICREFLLKCGLITGLENDIFFLEFPEVMRVLKGDREPERFIKIRKENVKKYKKLPKLPTIIKGRFDPFSWAQNENRRIDFYDANQGEIVNQAKGNTIKGYGGAWGVVEGTVHILDDFSQFEEFKPGEILVTTVTNIGWTPLFPKAAAIITDIGAPLSHGAIVAREFGIPAVVGCKDATYRLKNGAKVRVDGAKGIVTIL